LGLTYADGEVSQKPMIHRKAPIEPSMGSARHVWIHQNPAGPRAQRIEQRLIDHIVQLAHEQPEAAAGLIGRDACLAGEASSWGESAVQAASQLGHRELLSHLREIGVELDLFAACALGDRKLIRARWRADSSISLGIHSLPLLHFGIVSRDLGIVEMLLEFGAEVNPDAASISPLHSAVAIGSWAMVRFLLTVGASPSAVDAFGATPVDWAYALENRDSQIVNLFEKPFDSNRLLA
jgi:ankyrin repeat protein